MNMARHPYIAAAIEGEVARLSSAQEGERNQTLFKSSAAVASLGLREGEIIHLLKPVADAIGMRGKEFYSTVKSGVRAGAANPREIPQSARGLSHPDAPSEHQKPSFIAGATLPTLHDEVRRHAFRRDGQDVRIKIKRSSGQYSNWYRASNAGRDGWQAAKPEGYVACPYVGALDPFDPELAGDVIYWPEGERDCDTLGRCALPAFTFGGTGDGLPDAAADFLKGRHVVILADNDEGGRAHAARKAAIALPVAASVKVIEFPELPPKSDVTDFLQAASVNDLERRVSEVPLWQPVPSPASGDWRHAVINASQLRGKEFSPVRYVLPGYIPEGVTIFAGKPKIGKSWLLYDVCLACTADRFVLGTLKPSQGDVLYLALEDSQRRLKRRLHKLYPDGAWPSRLSLATDWRRADSGGLDDIAGWCDSVTDPVLIVIDTLEKFRAIAKSNAPAYSTDYLAISGLQKLAHTRGVAIVVIHHVRKMEAEDPFDMVSGTNGLTGAADTILVLKRQGGNVTLFARGRDIEEKETACRFEKSSCRWTLLGEAEQVYGSGERAAIVAALTSASEAGMHISEIMAAIERTDRNAVDQLLFKMQRDGELVRIKRGVYALAGKIGKKERNGSQPFEKLAESDDLTDLTDLTGTERFAGSPVGSQP